ncbi:TetR/AcrR family transcriptional regulator [Ancylomarina longa]|uniref:TetR/AcrR family transcriptional regulator n=1 Tax=Ancylomarina longa TaxID=2487017 RepID=A0A434AZI4_9BACT|nr:TetR/AcrR family transcriptional regulator [Ancylomarina longa]RUT79944.1 TetR/AcrR family transcriptional regulator [Ancylomarina longa]
MAVRNKIPIEEERKEILRKALEIFVRDGYFTTTGAVIAQEIGIPEDTLFRYFETKEDLLHTIVGEAFHLFFDSIDPNQDGVIMEVELLFFIEDYFESLEKNLDFLRQFYSLRLQPGVVPLYKNELVRIVSPLLELLINYFADSGAENPKMETRFLASMLDGIAMNYVLEPEGYPLHDMEHKVLNMYIRAAEYEE